MRARREALLALVLAAGCGTAITGCSALGLSSFSIGECNDSSDCRAANNAHHVPEDACMRFVCEFPRDPMGHPITGAAGTCVRGLRDDDSDGSINVACAPAGTESDCNDADATVRGGSAEVCDGADNDCDGIVDDGLAPLAETERLLGTASGELVLSSGGSAFLAGAPGERVFGTIGSGPSTAAPIGYRMHTPPTEVEARVCTPPRSGSISQTTLVDGCPSYRPDAPPGEPPVTSGECDLAETAFAESMSGYVVAAVNRVGCAAGQLRIGLVPAADGGAIELRGPIGRSNLWLGVDRGADGCTGSGAAHGVSGLQLAMAPDGTSGLVSFLGAPADHACGGGAAPVQVLGILRQQVSSGASTIDVLNGSDGGIPTTLDMSPGVPGMTPLPPGAGDGFLVASSTTEGAIVIRQVSAAFSAPTLPRLADESADACVVNDPVDTAPLASPVTLATIPSVGTVEAVAIAALAQTTPDELHVGVAFQTGCGAAAEIVFAMRAPDGTISDALVVGSGTDPRITAVPYGLVVAGFSRGGHTADEASTGGFVVAYRTGGGWRTIRIAAFDGGPLSGTEETIAADELAFSGTDAAWRDAAGVHSGAVTCAPSAPGP